MTPRERVKTALNHEEPDRVPTDLGGGVSSITAVAYQKLIRYLGIPGCGKVGEFKVMEKLDEELLTLLGVDFRHVFARPPEGWKPETFPDGSFSNEWGIRLKDVGEYTEIVYHPLANATLYDLESFTWPDFSDRSRVRGLKEEVLELYEKTEYAICLGSVGGRILEQCQWLRGMEKFMIDLVANKDFAHALLDKMVELQKQFFANVLSEIGEYVEVVVMGDDLASQDRLLMSPELYREMIKPRQYELFSFVKKLTRAKIMYHSDGAVYPLIGDLVEIGVDILNPLQPLAKGMDLERIKREFGKKLCFWGGIDIQRTLPFGSKEDIIAEVKERLRVLGEGGGYVLAPAHNIQSDIPPENVIALYRAAKEYGCYPLENCLL
ncbi:MAG: uroporphyrinogen decarboxylase family protein [Candidatus Caldatribacteriaceae bacterium]